MGGAYSGEGHDRISAFNPETLETLDGEFCVATDNEINIAMHKAHEAWKIYRNYSGKQKAAFLLTIAEEIEGIGSELIIRAMEETGLTEARLVGERGRTCNQLRMFASVVEEGSWVGASIDTAIPDRSPVSRPDIRKMKIAIGPVVVFTASNFPLAFSTAGGDTASALAVGCPVVVKAHESHPGTHALVVEAIRKAAERTGMPDGVFSALYGQGNHIGIALVEHPFTQAIAFTGSFRGGKSLLDLANRRSKPIPVFAEMGSVNPVFLLPSAVGVKAETTATLIANSVTLGAGQFCTNPGIVVLTDNENTFHFVEQLKLSFTKIPAATMLNRVIFENYKYGKNKCLSETGVWLEYEDNHPQAGIRARAAVAAVSAKDFVNTPSLHEEVFGPFTLLVKCRDESEMYSVARVLEGQLAFSVFGNESELNAHKAIIELLEEKAGRIIFNGMPTGVEVCPSMHHGGPFPATTDSRFTSVGTSAIERFVRPVAFQDCPESLLPEALKNGNPLGIWRTVNGVFMKS